MCLKLINGVHMYTAETDMVCYKHLVKRDDYDGKVTTYRNFPIKLGRTYESELKTSYDYGNFEINIGLHSFKDISDCIGDCNSEENGRHILRSYVIECIIPQGSNYFIGSFCGMTGYASNKLKYGRILKSKTIRKVVSN